MKNKIEEKILELAEKVNLSELYVSYNDKKVQLQRFFVGPPEVNGLFIKGYSLLLCNSTVKEEGHIVYKQGGTSYPCFLSKEDGTPVLVKRIKIPVVQWFDKEVKSQDVINEFFSTEVKTVINEDKPEIVETGVVEYVPNEKYEAIKSALEKAGYEEQVHENYRFFDGEEPILIVIKEEGFDELEHSKESSEGDNVAFIGDEGVVQVALSEGKVANIQKITFEKTKTS
jgi:hypothetical protein